MEARVGGDHCPLSNFNSLRLNSEDRFSSFLGSQLGYNYSATFPTGRAALVYALKDAGITEADDVLIPGYTCHAVDQAVRLVANPVYVDVLNDGCIDVNDAREKITDDTAAIVPVHTFGRMADVAAISRFATENGLLLIEDACHALGATHISDKVGSTGDYCFFSFRFSKEVTKFRGGLLFARKQLNRSDTSSKSDFPWIMGLLLACIGYRVRGALPGRLFHTVQSKILTPLFTSSSASIDAVDPVELSDRVESFLLKQYEGLSNRIDQRRRNARLYCEYLEGIDEDDFDEKSSFYRYSILVEGGADELNRNLHWNGIGTSRMYSYVVSPSGTCPQAENIANGIVNLPVHEGTDESIIRKVSELVNSHSASVVGAV